MIIILVERPEGLSCEPVDSLVGDSTEIKAFRLTNPKKSKQKQPLARHRTQQNLSPPHAFLQLSETIPTTQINSFGGGPHIHPKHGYTT